MDALVMAGGRGTRLDATVEKPLFEVGGRPMIDRVVEALDASAVETTYVATSPHAPDTRSFLADRPVEVVETPGEGYVPDLADALDRIGTPLLTVAADLPLLSEAVVDRILAAHDEGSIAVCVPAALKRQLGVSSDRALDAGGSANAGGDGSLAPTGVNVVSESNRDRVRVSHDVRLAVNVNRRADARVAESLLETGASEARR